MPVVYTVSPDKPHALAVQRIADELMRGALALLPTETVYGVGVAIAPLCEGNPATAPMPSEGSGYRRIFSLKQRDLAQTVPWLVGGPDALDVYGSQVDERARVLADEFWPGALTIVVRASDNVPAFLRKSDGTVALRASASAVVRALIARTDSPLAVTSANTHGMPAPVSFAMAESRIVAGVDVAVDAGETPCRDASTIVSFESGSLEVVREGALKRERIVAALAAHGMEC